MICFNCTRKDHDHCKGGTWCDCQHQPSGTPNERENENDNA